MKSRIPGLGKGQPDRDCDHYSNRPNWNWKRQAELSLLGLLTTGSEFSITTPSVRLAEFTIWGYGNSQYLIVHVIEVNAIFYYVKDKTCVNNRIGLIIIHINCDMLQEIWLHGRKKSRALLVAFSHDECMVPCNCTTVNLALPTSAIQNTPNQSTKICPLVWSRGSWEILKSHQRQIFTALHSRLFYNTRGCNIDELLVFRLCWIVMNSLFSQASSHRKLPLLDSSVTPFLQS